MIHSVAIAWDELLKAFSNMEQDRVYFFDKITGEIFFVRADLEDSFWENIEQHQERFLEIPVLDTASDRKLLFSFMENQPDQELRKLLDQALSGRPPFASPADILSFFPEEESQLAELRDSFLSNRVKVWMEENNLFSFSTSLKAIN